MDSNVNLNFSLPIDLSHLENDRLRLVHLEENLPEWAAAYVADANLHPQVYTYLTYGPFASAEEYITHYEDTSRSNPDEILLAILLKAGSIIRRKSSQAPLVRASEQTDTVLIETTIETETFAGIAGIVSQPQNLIADIGQLLLTPYHRTWVGTETNALLLHHLLDPPCPTLSQVSDMPGPGSRPEHDEQLQADPIGGLGLRRVQWQTNASNQASVNAALRLGFELEGIMRWAAVLPWGKEGDHGWRMSSLERGNARIGDRNEKVAYGSVTSDGQEEDDRGQQDKGKNEVDDPDGERFLLPHGWDHDKAGQYGPGRHTAMLAICWDDWLLRGAREKLDALVGR
ncbi:putative GNAT family acetyltransferase [Rhypophila decipiens]